MKHFGDITKLSGYDLPPVDIITGGSPCQDLSVAGKRAGLAGARSGLFMEQIRIIKEMRENDRANGRTDEHIRPRYMVWENVPGALSSPGGSHKGEDFQAVLTEIVRIVKADACDVPLPKDRRWPHAGCLMGIGDNGQPFSVAYRLHDAQFWGVPQRRKRIALVADFGGITAPEILFERKGVSGDLEESGETWERAAGNAGAGTKEASGVSGINDEKVYCLQGNGIDRADTAGCNGKGWRENESFTLNTIDRHAVCVENHPNDSRCKIREDGKVQTLSGRMGTGGGNVPMVMEPQAVESHAQDARYNVGYINQPLFANMEHDPGNGGLVMSAMCFGNGQTNQQKMSDKTGALNCMHDQQAVLTYGIDQQGGKGMAGYSENVSTTLASDSHVTPHGVCYGLDRAAYNQGANAQYDFSVEEEKIATQVAKGPWAVCQSIDCSHADDVVRIDNVAPCMQGRQSQGGNNVFYQSIVRRLTPLECERLQGFPDHWTDIGEWVDSKGKKHKDADSPRYKALGNSIALPFWEWMAKRMVSHLDEEVPTMGSLFDGLGGFALVFQRAGAEPIGASEIEEFCIAVTKIRFKEDEE